MVLNDRDMLILQNIARWRIVLGRHLKELSGFSGERACERRLKLLFDNKLIERQKYLYGVSYVYSLTHKSRVLLGLNPNKTRVRLDEMRHDILVLDTVIKLMETLGLKTTDFKSEKEMQTEKGFGSREHRPDFIYIQNDKKIACEIETSVKAKSKLEKNVMDNFLYYARQIWFLEREGDKKIAMNLEALQTSYPNLEISYI
jgi:hypothetical protein